MAPKALKRGHEAARAGWIRWVKGSGRAVEQRAKGGETGGVRGPEMRQRGNGGSLRRGP